MAAEKSATARITWIHIRKSFWSDRCRAGRGCKFAATQPAIGSAFFARKHTRGVPFIMMHIGCGTLASQNFVTLKRKSRDSVRFSQKVGDQNPVDRRSV